MHRIDKDLYVAANEGRTEDVEHLLDYGANVNTVQKDCETPLLASVKNRYEETSMVLIDHGANVNSVDKTNSTPLMYSISYSLTEVFKRLLDEKKCKLDIRGHDGKTALHLAALQGKPHYANLLIEKGSDVNVKDDTGRIPLCYVSKVDDLKQLEVASNLLKNGSIVDCIDKAGMTPLMFAIMEQRTPIAKILLENGSDVKTRNNQGKTLLHLAAEKGNSIELLLKHGALVNDQDNDKATPLIRALANNNEKAALILINRAADLNTVDCFGWTPLIHALNNDMTIIAETLIQKGCDLNAQTKNMKTGLHIVCQKNLSDAIHLLLDYRAKVNVQDGDGETPLTLYLSCIARDNVPDMEIIKMFLKNESDWSTKNKQNETAIHHALRLGTVGLEIVKMVTLKGFCSPRQLSSVLHDTRMVTVFDKFPGSRQFFEQNCGGN